MENSGSERLDRIEHSIEALISTSASMFAQTDQHLARIAEMQAKHEERLNAQEQRLNDDEEAILDVEAEHRRLLTAQILTVDNLNKVTETLAKSAMQIAEIDAKLNALIAVVDDWIRRQPMQ